MPPQTTVRRPTTEQLRAFLRARVACDDPTLDSTATPIFDTAAQTTISRSMRWVYENVLSGLDAVADLEEEEDDADV